MTKVISREMNWGDQVLKIETGKVAKTGNCFNYS